MGRSERGEFYFLLYKLHSLILLLYFDKIKMINKKRGSICNPEGILQMVFVFC